MLRAFDEIMMNFEFYHQKEIHDVLNFLSVRSCWNLSFSHPKVCVQWRGSMWLLKQQSWQHTFILALTLGILFIITPGKITTESRISFLKTMPHSSSIHLATRFVHYYSSKSCMLRIIFCSIKYLKLKMIHFELIVVSGLSKVNISDLKEWRFDIRIYNVNWQSFPALECLSALQRWQVNFCSISFRSAAACTELLVLLSCDALS